VAVGYHQASAVTRGLYQRVIALSGASISSTPATLKESEEAGLKYQAAVGAKSLAEMRALPMVQLLQPVPGATLRAAGIDGYFLTESPGKVFAAGKQVDVPAIFGNARDEGAIAGVKTVAEFRAAVTKAAGAKADEIFRLFPVSRDEDVPAVATRVANAAGAARQMLTWARAQAATGKSPVYMDVFARGSATHGSDLPYWFDVLDLPGALADPTRPIDAVDRDVAVKMDDAIVAFVKTGDPSTKTVKWPKYTRADEVRLEFGDVVKAVPADAGVKFFVENPDIRIGGLGGAPIAGGRTGPL